MLKKLILVFVIIIITISIYNIRNDISTNASSEDNNRKVVNVGVSFFDFDDLYLSYVRRSLQEIQNRHPDSVKFNFLNAKDNQAIQDENIDYLSKEDFDIVLINLHDINENTITDALIKNKVTNKPVIFFNVEPFTIPPILKSYEKAVIISNDAKQSGILEGKIIVDAWNSNKSRLDKNNDNILDYVMLKGERDNIDTIDRSKYSISTINEAGIKTNELATIGCRWKKNCAKIAVKNLFFKFGDKIEAIIANNDAMAIGAIEALQEYGYNTGHNSKQIAVVGIDAVPEAKELVDKGIMTGTVIQDYNELAEALYTVGMNLVNNRPPLENTNYKFNKSGVTIELPYYEYKKS